MLSVIIITKNESQHIKNCLDSVSFADEIIVLDSGSDDDTVTLCRQYTKNVFISDWPGFGLQKQRALDKAKGDWVLSIDADESVSPELKAEIQQAIQDTETDAFEIPRLSNYCGREIKHGGWWPDYVLRLFRREKGCFTPDQVHERIIVTGNIKQLTNHLLHDSFVNPAEVLDKINSYSSLGAKKLYEKGKHTSLAEAIMRGFWTCFRTYILKAAFLDGRQGLMLAISNGEGSYYKYAKLLDLQRNMTESLSISVIVTTYNSPNYLKASIDSLLAQTDKNFEILIADDGSTEETATLIQNYIEASKAIPIQHIYQEDEGFRAGRIRNQAILKARGDYIIFIDGDCVVRNDFIKSHRELAIIGHFVAGNRVLLSESFTEQVFAENIALYDKNFNYFFKLRLDKKINRLISFIKLPLGRFRYLQPKKWQKAIGCNTAVWKKDLQAINGYDESFKGWGYEDSDMLIRLLHLGIKRKEGRFAVPVMHLWHKQNDRSTERENYQRLITRLNDPTIIRAEKGLEH